MTLFVVIAMDNRTQDYRQIFNEQYKKYGEELPWCLPVQKWYSDIIQSGWVKPCNALDIGCGVGDHSAYLAQYGFHVTAIDFSYEGISMAQKKYEHLIHPNSPGIDFLVMDVKDLPCLNKKFGLVNEISVLHHIRPKERSDYARLLAGSLEPGGKLLMCCFSDEEETFHGKQEVRMDETESNNKIFPLSEYDIEKTYSPFFNIEDIAQVRFGKQISRLRHVAKMNLLF
jgi:2-polyprenyl-3-methyl-5-hydroxy-6-metoxy-1,4-benzoquinol methylase